MSETTEHGLVCLGPQEYAAAALAMQVDAQVITAVAAAQSSALTTYNNRPWLVATSTGNIVTAQNVTDPTYTDTGFPGAVVMTLTSGSTVQQSRLTQFNGSGVPAAGWYHVGGFATFQATGAVNTFTRRILAVQWFHSENLDSIAENVIQNCYESNTGGDAATVQGMFYANGINDYTVTLYFAHRNSSSTMQVNSGAKMWVTYLGSGVVI